MVANLLITPRVFTCVDLGRDHAVTLHTFVFTITLSWRGWGGGDLLQSRLKVNAHGQHIA